MALLAILLSACAPPPDPALGLTAAAQYPILATSAAIARTTATFEADRRAVTRIAALDVLARASQRQSRLVNTLEALDLPRPDVSLITPAAPATSAIRATPTLDRISGVGGITLAAPTLDPNLTPTFTPPPTEVLPPTHTLSPDAPRLAGVVTSTGVDSNDCPLSPTSIFNTATPQIYVAATAFNLAPGDVVGSLWLKDGAEVAFYEFAPDFEINGACIWFFVDQSDFTFTTGSEYRIDVTINNNIVQMLTFTIE